MRVTNGTRDGSGIADKFKFPNAVDSQFEVQATLLIPSATVLHAIMVDAASATVAHKAMAFTMTIGGVEVTCNCVLVSARHSASRGELQTIDVTLRSQGTPTKPVTAGSIYTMAITGSAATTFWLDTEAGQYGLTGAKLPAICTECSFSFSNGSIVENDFTFEIQGAPTLTTSS